MRRNRSFKRKHALLVGVLMVALLPLTGCWSATEADNLAVVNTIGIDQDQEGQVKLTAVIVKPKTLFSQQGVQGGNPRRNSTLIETTTGKNIYEALGKLSNAIPERVYVGHLNTIVFGEQAARQRMVPLLDFFKRMNDFRPNIKLLVTKGPARKLVQTVPQMNETIGLDIQALTERNGLAPSKMVQDVSQFTEELLSNTTDPYTGVLEAPRKRGIQIPPTTPAISQKGWVSGEKGKTLNVSARPNKKVPKVLSLQGTAVFKGGHLAGFLDDQETRGLLMIKGELENGIVVLNCGGNGKGTISLMIKDTNSQMTPDLSGQIPEMDVKIHVKAVIQDVACPRLQINTNSIDRLDQQLGDVIKQNVRKALNKAKNQWQTDIFGFGQAIYRRDPKRWDQMAPQWRKGLLKKMNVHVTVSANILRHGLLKDPIKANESR